MKLQEGGFSSPEVEGNPFEIMLGKNALKGVIDCRTYFQYNLIFLYFYMGQKFYKLWQEVLLSTTDVLARICSNKHHLLPHPIFSDPYP